MEDKIDLLNEVKITGKIYNVKHETTSSGTIYTTFGLSVWAGKKDGKNVYEFISCEMWKEHLVVSEGNKDVTGKLKVRSWTGKDGNKQVKISIDVESVVDSGKSIDSTPKPQKNTEPELDDDLPF